MFFIIYININNDKVFSILKLSFLVLCLNIIIPSIEPIPQPKKDIDINTISGILHILCIALYLSRPYSMNEIILIIIRYMYIFSLISISFFHFFI